MHKYAHELENNELIHHRFLEGDLNSHSSIDRAYQTLVSEITVAARKCFPVKKFNRLLKPYWNQEPGDFQKRMTLKRTAWVAVGKSRESDCLSLSYVEYKSAKREFRRSHRKCVNKYLQDQIDQIDKVTEVDGALFWRLINARRKTSNSRSGAETIFNGRHCNTSAEINLYGPNKDDVTYCETLESYLDNNEEKTFILLGGGVAADFNTVLNINLDKKHGRSDKHRLSRQEIHNIINKGQSSRSPMPHNRPCKQKF